MHGRGVFALKNFKKGEIIEKCPIILLNKKDLVFLDKTPLYDYYFSWVKGGGVIALGFGSIYNHSYEPNAVYKKDVKNNLLIFKALRNIKKGEEINVNYNGDPKNKEKVWFEKI